MKFKNLNGLIFIVTMSLLFSFFNTGRLEALDYDDYVVDVLINDPDCSLQVTDWNAWYRSDDTITFGDAFIAAYNETAPTVREAGFQYDLEVFHVAESTTDIIAYQVNVVVFSAFDEYSDTFGIFQGAVLRPDKSVERNNSAIFNGDNSFLTFFIWVDKVRDADGNIYFADLENIKSEIDTTMGIDIPFEFLEAGHIVEINQQERFRERVYADVY